MGFQASRELVGEIVTERGGTAVRIRGLLPNNAVVVTLHETHLERPHRDFERVSLAIESAAANPVTTTLFRSLIPDEAFRVAEYMLRWGNRSGEMTISTELAANGRILVDVNEAGLKVGFRSLTARRLEDVEPRVLKAPTWLKGVERGKPFPKPPPAAWRRKILDAAPASTEAVEAVAELYMWARSLGVPLTPFVVWALQTSKATASRRIHAAADAGMIQLPNRKPAEKRKNHA